MMKHEDDPVGDIVCVRVRLPNVFKVTPFHGYCDKH